MKYSSYLFVLIAVATACAASKDQGIQGTVQWVVGNQMPGPDKAATPQNGVVREIHIFPTLHVQNHKPVDGFYQKIAVAPVAIVKSTANGSFKVSLSPGVYSVLSKEDQGFFANLYDGDGCINCVVVKPHSYTEMVLKVDYEAAY